MSLQHEGRGTVRVKGCAGFSASSNYQVRFAVGERVWIGNKARKGKTESVVVKRFRVKGCEPAAYCGSDFNVVYTDTFNRVWMEYELVDQSEAQDLSEGYKNMMDAKKREFYEGAGCLPIKPEGCA